MGFVGYYSDSRFKRHLEERKPFIFKGFQKGLSLGNKNVSSFKQDKSSNESKIGEKYGILLMPRTCRGGDMAKSIAISDHFTYSKLIRYCLPSVTMMVFTSLYTIVDGFFVSNLAGEKAFTALNLIWPIIGILSSFGFMIGTGGTALVSKTLGEGDNQRACEYFTMLIVFEVLLGIGVSALTIVFLEPLARLCGATDDLLHDCYLYAIPLLACQAVCFMSNSYQSFLVAAGKPKFGLIISLACGGLNMVLDYVLIALFHLGILGASLATAFNWVLGGLIPTFWFWKHQENDLHFVKFKWKFKAIWQSCFNGISEMVTNLSLSFVLLLYNLVLMRIAGAQGVVVYGVVQYLGFLFAAVFLGYTLAVAPCIGYQYGAQNHEELKNLFHKSLILLAILSVMVVLMADAFAYELASLFVSYSKELMEMTHYAVQLYSLGFLVAGFNIFASGFFTALNNGPVSALLSLMRTFVFQALAVLVLPYFLGLTGVWMANFIAEILSLGLSTFFLLKLKKRYGY